MARKQDTELHDESGDKKYYVQVPQIVIALSRKPYDLAMWIAVKTIAGEYKDGYCRISGDELADFAGMSGGQAHDYRIRNLGLAGDPRRRIHL